MLPFFMQRPLSCLVFLLKESFTLENYARKIFKNSRIARTMSFLRYFFHKIKIDEISWCCYNLKQCFHRASINK